MSESDDRLHKLGEKIGRPLSFEEGLCSIPLDETLILFIGDDIDRNSWMISALLADEGEAQSIDPFNCLQLNFLLHARDLGSIALTHRYGPMFLVDRLAAMELTSEEIVRRIENFIETWRLVKLQLFFPQQMMSDDYTT